MFIMIDVQFYIMIAEVAWFQPKVEMTVLEFFKF